MNKSMRKGFSLLEILVATAIAALLLLGGISLIVISRQGSTHAIQYQQALWYAQQGNDILHAMDFDDLSVTALAYASYSSPNWSIVDGSSETIGRYTRSLAIEEVYRDDDCYLAETGTLDTDSYYLQSEVSWTDSRGNPQTISQRSLRTQWEDPQGPCKTSASTVTFDFSGATWYGGKQLRDIYLTNPGTSAVTISEITLTWDNGELIQQLFLDSSKIWSSSGPGSPSGEQPSGTLLDVEDTSIAAGATVEIPKVQFLDTMEGATMQFQLDFIDGSTVISDEFTPSY